MNAIKFLVCFFILQLGCECLYTQSVVMYSTTEQERWERSKCKFTDLLNDDIGCRIYVDSLLQEVEGFGGTFNEIGWDAMQYLNEEKRTEIINSLFGTEGINFSLARTPIGCSDYSLGYYSYNDVKDDYTMRNFSIGRDRFILIPFIKSALSVKPDLKIWASPWTPPIWMKVNEHYSQKSSGIEGTEIGHNRLDSLRNVLGNVTGFKMMHGYLKAYAIYFSKYIKEYKNNGVNISIIMPQNEIAWTPCWPSCTWRPEDFSIFINKYLKPQFVKDSINTQIWLGTVNYPNPDYIRRILKDNGSGNSIDGVGVQWSGMKALPSINKDFPNLQYMQTENICGNAENDWTALERTWKNIVFCFNNGVNSYMYWNMILNETGKSWWDWAQNSLVIINRDNGSVNYTPEYYLLKHLSHFLCPNTRLVKVSDSENVLAFKINNYKYVIVVYNDKDIDVEKTFCIKDKCIKLKLKRKSINTLVLSEI